MAKFDKRIKLSSLNGLKFKLKRNNHSTRYDIDFISKGKIRFTISPDALFDHRGNRFEDDIPYPKEKKHKKVKLGKKVEIRLALEHCIKLALFEAAVKFVANQGDLLKCIEESCDLLGVQTYAPMIHASLERDWNGSINWADPDGKMREAHHFDPTRPDSDAD